MTKTQKIERYIDSVMPGYELNLYTTSRYESHWWFINQETRGLIRVICETKTNAYQITYHEESARYGLVYVYVPETGEYREEMRWGADTCIKEPYKVEEVNL